uniref:acid phosphatase n=1 Tax=Kalanchoe fedtschenkoi TaxID=63787 RepID=A0A7N0SZT2_KALFE
MMMKMKSSVRGSAAASAAMCCLVLITTADFCNGGVTSRFVRKPEESQDMPLDADVLRVPPGYNAPQQVHITQGDHEGKGMIVSWVTQDEPGSSKLIYWTENGKKQAAFGLITTYNYYTYKSGYIHHCNLKNLEHDTKYYYEVGTGGNNTRQFWFKTPPKVGPDVPFTFGLIGMLPSFILLAFCRISFHNWQYSLMAPHTLYVSSRNAFDVGIRNMPLLTHSSGFECGIWNM